MTRLESLPDDFRDLLVELADTGAVAGADVTLVSDATRPHA